MASNDVSVAVLVVGCYDHEHGGRDDGHGQLMMVTVN